MDAIKAVNMVEAAKKENTSHSGHPALARSAAHTAVTALSIFHLRLLFSQPLNVMFSSCHAVALFVRDETGASHQLFDLWMSEK